MTSNSVPVGQRIRDLRIARGMTQEKLARMSGVDIKTIYRAQAIVQLEHARAAL